MRSRFFNYLFSMYRMSGKTTRMAKQLVRILANLYPYGETTGSNSRETMVRINAKPRPDSLASFLDTQRS